MRLTSRDLEIFKLISKTAILTTAQIEKAVFTSVATTTVLRRLRKLERAKFIQRIEGLPNHELAWALTLRGAQTVGYANSKRHFHRFNLIHDVKLADLRLTLEGHGVALAWTPEHEIRSSMARRHGLKRMKNQSVPDGMMVAYINEVMESVVLELELHYKNQDRYKATFDSYKWKKNIKAVWYLVANESLGRHLEKLWVKGGKYGPWFFWSIADDVLRNVGQAKLNHYDEIFLVEDVFRRRMIADLPAHPGGSGVSTFAEELREGKINLTPQNLKESSEVAS